jgi:hypothetical protein
VAHRPRASRSRARAWIWGLAALAAALAIALVVVLLTRDDDNGSGTAAGTTTTSTTTPSSTTSTTVPQSTTTTTRTPASTTEPLPPLVANDPPSFAQYLFAAWRNGDHDAAAKVASADAVNQMFAVPYDAARGYAFTNCGLAAGSAYCTWQASDNATIVIQVRTLTGGLPVQVIGVTRNP